MNSVIALAGGGLQQQPGSTTFFRQHPQLSSSSSLQGTGRSPEANEADFAITDMLGRGAFSVVCKAQHHPSNMSFALKKISRWDISHTPFLERCVKWEINVHRLLRHPNIIRLHTYFVTPQELVLVLELCDKGTLYRKLKTCREGCFDEGRAARYGRQIVRALVYLHENNVLHRDLKLENVLLDVEGRVKVADFGLSWQQAEADHGYMTGSPNSSPDRRNGFQGTLDYLAPEVISARSYSPKSDVWAVGVMIGEMLTGRPLFYNVDEKATMNNILYDSPQLPADGRLTSACVDLLRGILVKEPDARPTAATVLAHPWLQMGGLSMQTTTAGGPRQ